MNAVRSVHMIEVKIIWQMKTIYVTGLYLLSLPVFYTYNCYMICAQHFFNSNKEEERDFNV